MVGSGQLWGIKTNMIILISCINHSISGSLFLTINHYSTLLNYFVYFALFIFHVYFVFISSLIIFDCFSLAGCSALMEKLVRLYCCSKFLDIEVIRVDGSREGRNTVSRTLSESCVLWVRTDIPWGSGQGDCPGKSKQWLNIKTNLVNMGKDSKYDSIIGQSNKCGSRQ